MSLIAVFLLAVSGPALAGAAIGFDAALLGWPETRARLRENSTLPAMIAGIPPLLAGAGALLGYMAGSWEAAAALGIFGGAVAAVGASLVTTVVLFNTLQGGWLRRTQKRLLNPRTREDARDRLLASLRRAESSGSSGYPARLMIAIHQLTRARMWDDVVRLAEEANTERLNSLGRQVLRLYVALARLHEGRADLAREAIDTVDPALPNLRARGWLSVLDAVVSSLEGRTDRARKIVQDLDPKEYRVERAVALAHALAAEGQSVEAREELVRVRIELQGDLEPLFLVPGPATPIATALVTGRDSPFR